MADNRAPREWHSGCESGECVEVCFEDQTVLIRGSRDKDGPMLVITRQEWVAFQDAVASGRING